MPITYLVGDATQPQGEGLKIIAHIVNDAFVPWQSTKRPTFAKALGQRWPDAERDYLAWYQWRNTRPTLGAIRCFWVKDDIHIFHLLAQRGLRSRDNPVPLDYAALNECLALLLDQICRADHAISLHMPRIGAGFAGGDWAEIAPMIEGMTTLYRRPLQVFIYDLPKEN